MRERTLFHSLSSERNASPYSLLKRTLLCTAPAIVYRGFMTRKGQGGPMAQTGRSRLPTAQGGTSSEAAISAEDTSCGGVVSTPPLGGFPIPTFLEIISQRPLRSEQEFFISQVLSSYHSVTHRLLMSFLGNTSPPP